MSFGAIYAAFSLMKIYRPLPLRVEAFAEFLDILQLLDAETRIKLYQRQAQKSKRSKSGKRWQGSNPAWARFAQFVESARNGHVDYWL